MEECVKDSDVLNEFSTEWEDALLQSELFSQSVQEVDYEDLPRPEHLEVLSKCFGHKKFRPLQWKIINSVIKCRRDNCAVMATGYGKSLCFQYPSAYLGGVTIVISPLISLMEDQVLSLQVTNIPACLLGTAQTKQKQVIEDILDNKYRIIYITPEFCTGGSGEGLLKQMVKELTVNLIAIDEAHCVSSWGHDFRFSYRQLGILRDLLPDVPILAVTATATPKVRQDILNVLKLRNPQISCSGFDRPNLFFEVHMKGNNVYEDIKKVMVRQGGAWVFSGPTIIYCITRKSAEEVSIVLNAQGINCLPYHAGLPLKVRKEAHENFVRDKVQVIVATIAFGMGIDKPDVRNVIHYGASSSLEGYYQEVGRAGRDGLPSKCVIFFANGDFNLHIMLRDSNKYGSNKNKENMLELMKEYLLLRGCRRKFILSYFQDNVSRPNNKNCCDNCVREKHPTNKDVYEELDEEGKYDFTEDALLFLKSVDALEGKFGIGMYILFLRGSKSSKLYEKHLRHVLYGCGKHKSENWWKGIATVLECEKFLSSETKKSGRFSFQTINVSRKGLTFCRNAKNGAKLLAVPTPDILSLLKKKTPASSEWICVGAPSISEIRPSTSKVEIGNLVKEEEKENKMKLYRLMMNCRSELASKNDCMPYMIASNAALMEISMHKPRNLEELRALQVDGFTEVKLQKFGQEFLDIINTNCGMTESKQRTIEAILKLHPLEDGISIGSSALSSYSLFKNGHSVQNIREKRGFAESTIIGHLTDALKLGYVIKMKDLGVTDDVRDKIIEVISMVDTGWTLLTSIKNQCPEEITFNQIKVVTTFLKIRAHLNSLNMPYEEFEDISYDKAKEIKSLINSKSTKSVPNTEWLSTATCVSQIKPSTRKDGTVTAAKFEEEEKRMKLYRQMMNRRSQLATQNDCMPYMIATNDALMKIATHKPKTLQELKDLHIEGFTDVKLHDYGPEFLKIIQVCCGFTDELTKSKKQTIQEILNLYPLSDFVRMDSTAHSTYSLFKNGHTIQEIVKNRGLTEGVIIGHLIDALLLGYPIKMKEFGITDHIRETIIQVVNKLDTGWSVLTSIKNACPEEITFNQIKVVSAYLKIRAHLKDLNIPYIEFEDVSYIESEEITNSSNGDLTKDSKVLSNETDEQSVHNLNEFLSVCHTHNFNSDISTISNKGDELKTDRVEDLQLLAACDELENSIKENGRLRNENEDSDTTIILDDEPPLKKSKNDDIVNTFALLDSPPHGSQFVQNEEPIIHDEVTISVPVRDATKNVKKNQPGNPCSSKSKKKLPPWMSAKRIA